MNTADACKLHTNGLDTLKTFYLQKEGNGLFNDTLNTFYLWRFRKSVLFNDTLNTFYLWKEMFYLMTHSTHYIYGRKEGNVLFNDTLNTFYLQKEVNVLFNDTLNTFYLRLYGVRYMVEDHSDSERGNLLQCIQKAICAITVRFEHS